MPWRPTGGARHSLRTTGRGYSSNANKKPHTNKHVSLSLSETRFYLHGVEAPLSCRSRWHVSQYSGSISLTLWASICSGLSGPHIAPCCGPWQRGIINIVSCVCCVEPGETRILWLRSGRSIRTALWESSFKLLVFTEHFIQDFGSFVTTLINCTW